MQTDWNENRAPTATTVRIFSAFPFVLTDCPGRRIR